MSVVTGVFIIIMAGIVGGTIAEIAKAWARRGASPAVMAQLKGQVEQCRAALEEAQAALADQGAQVAELQERLDFAERLLAQARDRAALGPGPR